MHAIYYQCLGCMRNLRQRESHRQQALRQGVKRIGAGVVQAGFLWGHVGIVIRNARPRPFRVIRSLVILPTTVEEDIVDCRRRHSRRFVVGCAQYVRRAPSSVGYGTLPD